MNESSEIHLTAPSEGDSLEVAAEPGDAGVGQTAKTAPRVAGIVRTHHRGDMLEGCLRSPLAAGKALFMALIAIACRIGHGVEWSRAGLSEKRFRRRLKSSWPGRVLLRLARGLAWAFHSALALLNVRRGRLNVQLQTTSLCNASCAMCPYPESWAKDNPGLMSDALFERILSQLENTRIGKLCLYLENEPLMDAKLFDRLREAIGRLDFRLVEVSTNASVLTSADAGRLANVLEGTRHAIWVNFHGIDEQSYRQLMGLDFHTVLGNVIDLLKVAQQRDLKVQLRGLGMPVPCGPNAPVHFSRREYLDFWERQFRTHGIVKRPEVLYMAYHDRANSIHRDSRYQFSVTRGSLLGMYCSRGERWLHVLYNGDVILCCNDYHRRTVIGSLDRQGLKELLRSREFRDYRLKVLGLRASSDDFLCRHCTNPGG